MTSDREGADCMQDQTGISDTLYGRQNTTACVIINCHKEHVSHSTYNTITELRRNEQILRLEVPVRCSI